MKEENVNLLKTWTDEELREQQDLQNDPKRVVLLIAEIERRRVADTKSAD